MMRRGFLALTGAALVLTFQPLDLEAAARWLRDAPWLQHTDRTLVRAVFFSREGVAATYSIDYGRPQWNESYDQGFDDLTLGKRLRLGQDQWTSLDSQCSLRIAGKEVKPGQYYLALERSKKGAWSLVLLDPDSIRKRRMDAFQTADTNGGTAIEMDYSEVQEPVNHLTITLEPDEKNEFNQTLHITFGKHRLSAAIDAKV